MVSTIGKNQDLILAENLKRFRRKKSWNQNQLAEAADLSLGAIKQIETGQRWPRKETLEDLARALDVTVPELTSAETKNSHTIESLLSALQELQKENELLRTSDKTKDPQTAEFIQLWQHANERQKNLILRMLRGPSSESEQASKKKA